MMTLISSEFMKYDGYCVCQSKIGIRDFVSRGSAFTCQMTMDS